MRLRGLLPLLLGASAASFVAAAEPSGKAVLPWIADDYSKALAEARAKKVPIFVEAWAPW